MDELCMVQQLQAVQLNTVVVWIFGPAQQTFLHATTTAIAVQHTTSAGCPAHHLLPWQRATVPEAQALNSCQRSHRIHARGVFCPAGGLQHTTPTHMMPLLA
jgi:hypothetical protein